MYRAESADSANGITGWQKSGKDTDSERRITEQLFSFLSTVHHPSRATRCYTIRRDEIQLLCTWSAILRSIEDPVATSRHAIKPHRCRISRRWPDYVVASPKILSDMSRGLRRTACRVQTDGYCAGMIIRSLYNQPTQNNEPWA